MENEARKSEQEKKAAQDMVAKYCRQINETPALLSLLYDADLLPEQIVTMRGAVSMAAVCIAYNEGLHARAPTRAEAGTGNVGTGER